MKGKSGSRPNPAVPPNVDETAERGTVPLLTVVSDSAGGSPAAAAHSKPRGRAAQRANPHRVEYEITAGGVVLHIYGRPGFGENPFTVSLRHCETVDEELRAHSYPIEWYSRHSTLDVLIVRDKNDRDIELFIGEIDAGGMPLAIAFDDKVKSYYHRGKVYTPDLMDDAAARIKAAAEILSTVYPAEDVERALEDLAAKAARETTARTTEQPRPKWDRDRLGDETPAHFAARAGYEHRGMIHDEDRALSVKLSNWLRTHDWPEGVRYVPTKPEWNDRQVERLPQLRDEKVREAERVAAAASRRRRSKQAAL